MKKYTFLALTATAVIALSMPAMADSVRADSASQSSSNSSASAGAQAGALARGGDAGATGGNATGVGGNGGSGSVSNKNVYKAPGAIGAPGLAAGAQACLGSISGGVSYYGGGVGGGFTYLERACESRLLADQLYRYGMQQEAVNVLLYNHPLVISTARRGGFGASAQQRVTGKPTMTNTAAMVRPNKPRNANGSCTWVKATASTKKCI